MEQEHLTDKEKATVSQEPRSDIKGTVKDSVFRDLFKDRRYALQLYQAIHPKDVDVTESDIGNVTIDNIFTDHLWYNRYGKQPCYKVVSLPSLKKKGGGAYDYI